MPSNAWRGRLFRRQCGSCGLSRRNTLIVFEARDLILVHESRVPLQIRLRSRIVGFGLRHARQLGFMIPLGRGELRLCIRHSRI